MPDLPALWEAIPRRKAPDPVYARGCKQRLAAFADLAARFQRGVRDIPVFPMLREELAKARSKAGKSKFCFPAAAEMYRNNPDAIPSAMLKVQSGLRRLLHPASAVATVNLPLVQPGRI